MTLALEVAHGGPRALELIDSLTTEQLAALAYDWRGTWARCTQLAPEGAWLSWGFLAGRGFGKTRAISEWLLAQVEAGRVRRLALIAQNEDKTREILVDGNAGLVTLSPPWFRARFERGRVLWPNGAEAFIYTPEVPGDIRGPEHDTVWATELAAWPAATREEAWNNLALGLRLGWARFVWDTTPRRRHPLLRLLLARAIAHPTMHLVRRGSTRENVLNLNPAQLVELEKNLAGTQRGREELDGEFLDDDDGALWRNDWIAENMRDLPAKLVRRVLSVDPAISMRAGTDATGIVELGLGSDGQIFVLDDLSGHHSWETWGNLVLTRYTRHRCDMVIVERNRGGDACTANLRAAAKLVGLRIVIADEKHTPRHDPNTVHVREVIGRDSKAQRAEPVAAEYERGRVSHLRAADLDTLEEELCTWDGTGQSPNRLDALVHGVWELAGLGSRKVDRSAGVTGAAAIQRSIAGAASPHLLTALIPRQRGRASTL